MPKVEDILRLLENGKWHDLKEITEKTRINDLRIRSVTRFLAQHDFIELDGTGQKIRLDSFTQHFLTKIQNLEDEETSQ